MLDNDAQQDKNELHRQSLLRSAVETILSSTKNGRVVIEINDGQITNTVVDIFKEPRPGAYVLKKSASDEIQGSGI